MNSNACYISPWCKYAHHDPLNVKMCRVVFNFVHTFCRCCETGTTYSTHHSVFECTGATALKTNLWSRIVSVCPDNLINDLNRMPSSKKLNLVLNALCCEYVPEWQGLSEELASFVHTMYKSVMKEYVIKEVGLLSHSNTIIPYYIMLFP